jgi:phage host-nuclease inhibitor protein Gam
MDTTTTPAELAADPADVQPCGATLDMFDTLPEGLADEFPDAPLTMKARFEIVDEASAGWYLNKLAQIDDEQARIKAQSSAILAELRTNRESLANHFEPQLEVWAKEQLELRYAGKKRSLPLLQGTIAFRNVPASIRVANVAAATDYAKTFAPEMVQSVVTEVLDTTGYRQMFEATGDADMPGIETTAAHESMSIKFPKKGGAE